MTSVTEHAARTAHCTGALIDQDVVRLHEAVQVAVPCQCLQLLSCGAGVDTRPQGTPGSMMHRGMAGSGRPDVCNVQRRHRYCPTI